MRLYAGRARFAHFCAVLNCIFSRPEVASDIISGRFVSLAILDKYVKFRDPRLNFYPENRSQAGRSGIFDRFFELP